MRRHAGIMKTFYYIVGKAHTSASLSFGASLKSVNVSHISFNQNLISTRHQSMRTGPIPPWTVRVPQWIHLSPTPRYTLIHIEESLKLVPVSSSSTLALPAKSSDHTMINDLQEWLEGNELSIVSGPEKSSEQQLFLWSHRMTVRAEPGGNDVLPSLSDGSLTHTLVAPPSAN